MAAVHVVEAVEKARQRGLAAAGMADHRHGVARRHFQVDAVQDFAAAVVGETHVLERQSRSRGLQHGRSALVANFLLLLEQTPQAFDVRQRLLDLAVHHAEVVQRHCHLQQVGVHQHEVADAELADHHAMRRLPHQRGDADGDHRGLADVQHRQRLVALDVRFFHAPQALVVALGFVGLVVEVLDRLVIEQRIDRAGAGLGIGLDRGAIELRAPFGHRHRPGDIGDQHEQRDDGEPDVVQQHQHDRHQHHLDDRRNDRVQGPVQQVGNGAAATFDIARHAAGAAVEMEAQRKRVQMAEHRQHHHARAARHHPREDDLPHLGEHALGQARGAVGQQQRDRDQGRRRVDAERVDQPLQHHRHGEAGEFGRQQAGHGQRDAQPIRLEERQQAREHLRSRAFAGRAIQGKFRGGGAHRCKYGAVYAQLKCPRRRIARICA